MRACDLLRGGDGYGGSTENSPTEKQMRFISIIERYHPAEPKFFGVTSQDAYLFVDKYYVMAKLLEQEARAKFNRGEDVKRPTFEKSSNWKEGLDE